MERRNPLTFEEIREQIFIEIPKNKFFNMQTQQDEYIIKFNSMGTNKMKEAVEPEQGINHPYIFVGPNVEIAEKVLSYARGLIKEGKDEFDIYRETEKYYEEIKQNQN